jgi:hypothetical protein
MRQRAIESASSERRGDDDEVGDNSRNLRRHNNLLDRLMEVTRHIVEVGTKAGAKADAEVTEPASAKNSGDHNVGCDDSGNIRRKNRRGGWRVKQKEAKRVLRKARADGNDAAADAAASRLREPDCHKPVRQKTSHVAAQRQTAEAANSLAQHETLATREGRNESIVNLIIVGPGKSRKQIPINKDASVRELVHQVERRTGILITSLRHGVHMLNMNNRLSAYNLKDGEEIKAEGPINGGMQSPNSPSDAEAEGEASGRESEPEAESEQTGCCILTDEIIHQTDADRETAAGITAQ